LAHFQKNGENIHLINNLVNNSSLYSMGCCLATPISEETLPKDINLKELSQFVPPLKSGRVLKVYDGDTITIASRIPGLSPPTIFKFSIRLHGIDTPEITSKDSDEKEMAVKAREVLTEMLLGKDVRLVPMGDSLDKYGRLMCEVYLDKVCLNKWMIEKRYALPYDGKKKTNPESWSAVYYRDNQI
jgi:endonuclease YncB( thermonuclease family)